MMAASLDSDECVIPATFKVDYDKWSSYEIEPGVRACCLCKNGQLFGKFEDPPGVDTIWSVFKRGLAISEKRRCLGWRDGDTYKWTTYQEVYDRIRNVAGALAKNTDLKHGDLVGIFSASNVNWMVTSLATSSRSLVMVPLYDTLGVDACTYIIKQTEMTFLFVDTPAVAKQVLENAQKTPRLSTIVIFEEPGDEIVKLSRDRGIKLVSLDKFTENARDTPVEEAFDEPKPDDIFAIFYTSGTTGDPKGAIHTHESMTAGVLCGVDEIVPGLDMTRDDIHLIYLSLAHVLSYSLTLWFMYYGAASGFFSGNVQKLTEDAQILKPTFIPFVPRILNRIYGKIVGELEADKPKSEKFWAAYNCKLDLLRQGQITRESEWDRAIFHEFQAILGGRLRSVHVGAAPVSAEILEFFRVVFGIILIEGYGQTETACCATLALDSVGGNVGHPTPCNYIKLVDAPECGYYVNDGNKGELCIKGINIMKGYYKMADKTAETIDADGWMHTGDIGQFLENGSLRIIDRKKHIFKMSQGVYIAPEKIESIYLLCPEIAQIFVDGNTLESHLVAVAVPDSTMAANYAAKNGLDAKTVHLDENYRRFIIKALRDIGKENSLNSLEQIRSIYLTNQPFTIESGQLTQTLKSKRPELRKFFKPQIDALYKAAPLV